MQIIKPNSKDQKKRSTVSIFLAGSIEMGKAEDWQKTVSDKISSLNVTIFNPRRDDWDESWEQNQNNDQFNYQVNWEMNSLENVDIVFMYFSPGTKSPISLLELGAFGDSKEMIVCCPNGFWRKGNVDIFCNRKNIPLFDNMDDAIGALITKIRSIQNEIIRS